MPRPRPAVRRPLEQVLVATDFSRTAASALARAARLPLARGASVVVLHVLSRDLEPPLAAREEAEALHRLDQSARDLAKAVRSRKVRGVEVRPVLIRGEPFVEIIRHAASAGAELVVLGRHGIRHFRDLLLGSTAERVIRKGSAPVLVVGGAVRGPYRRPMVAMDLSDTSRRALELADRLAPAASELHIVHAYETPHSAVVARVAIAPDLAEYDRQCRESAREALGRQLETLPGTAESRAISLRRGDPRGVVLAAVRRARADLVAVGSHGRSALAHVLIGSVAEAVIRHAHCDVLVARPDRHAFVHPLGR